MCNKQRLRSVALGKGAWNWVPKDAQAENILGVGMGKMDRTT